MKPPSIKDIAQSLGVSIGTVDRALHDRADVSAKTRTRVLKKSQQLGYRPNYAARALKLNRRLRIGVYFPQQIASFFDPLRAGVQAAADSAMGVKVELVFRSFPSLGNGDKELIVADSKQHFDGVLITPGNPKRLESVLNAWAQKGVAVVCVASDAPQSKRLACVTVDAYASGAIAAELFSRTIRKAGSLATMVGELSTLDHAEKLRGFAVTVATLAPHLELLPTFESHEQPEKAYQYARELIAHKPRPRGIYLSTANSLPVLRAIREQDLIGKVQVIATDLFPDLIPCIERGETLATLDQRPYSQGKIALNALLNYLMDGVVPPAITRLAPNIILRSNLQLFTGSAAKNSDGQDHGED